jgi:hypothetical protein
LSKFGGSTHGRLVYNPQVLPVAQEAALELNVGAPMVPPFTAKDEIFFFMFFPLHSGQWTSAVEKPITRVSKGFPQSWQSNS